ncbi:hypothetical protein EVAR_66615_1 [Eumeta japonica]|uniref:Uncharacterized protein n=1 Tax=Eumeta variegata TaxID=151549 RepID=A0A4C2A6K8_EUMVA|nr:hypothetical protein EVAR_66615_1 [Eumeta japonica]
MTFHDELLSPYRAGDFQRRRTSPGAPFAAVRFLFNIFGPAGINRAGKFATSPAAARHRPYCFGIGAVASAIASKLSTENTRIATDTGPPYNFSMREEVERRMAIK